MTETPADPLPAPPAPALVCTGLRKAFGETLAVADLTLSVGRGEIYALLGPSGCGKTTTLRLVAGFEQADAGTIHIGGREVARAGLHVPPERRGVGMVFQDYALFPHLTVAENVRYGLRAGLPGARLLQALRRGPGGAPGERVRETLDLVSLTPLADRYPHELSGGEAQRVALARALAPRPALVLLDEPFSNLDTSLRAGLRADVRQILRRAGAAAVFVTHDQEEALSLADRLGVMWQGRIEQEGSPQEIYQTPASRFVAEFVGDTDFLPGRVEQGRVFTEIGPLPLPAGRPRPAADVDVMLRPEALRLTPAAADAADSDVGRVLSSEYYGHDQLARVQLPSGRCVRVRLGPGDHLPPGERVRVSLTGVAAIFAPRRPAADGRGAA